MQSIEELTDPEKSAWHIIQQWIAQAKNNCLVLKKDPSSANRELFTMQMPTSSPMGAVIYETGGILIHYGWVRLLGSGSFVLPRGLMDWNFSKSYAQSGEKPQYLLVADDVIGGYFALNGGALGQDLGKIYYYSPKTLVWHSLNFTYTDFLSWLLNGNLEAFYADLFWDNWQEDVKQLDGNRVFTFEPELSEDKVMPMLQRVRKEINIETHYSASFAPKDKFEQVYSVN